MKRSHSTICRRVLVLSILLMLIFPLLEIKGHWFRKFAIAEEITPCVWPSRLWDGFFRGEWQAFLEQRFLYKLAGIRAFLILSYNEVKHRLFRKRPNDKFLWTPGFGYYQGTSICCLNQDVLHPEDVRQLYQRAAKRLRILQELLRHYGVTLLFVPAPTKVRLYPEYVVPYLIAPPETILDKAISYADVLEEKGVNVLNVGRILAERKPSFPWPFFTTTSFHWSYWTGCLVTNDILRKAEALTGRPWLSMDCSDVVYGKCQLADADIARVLNIFSEESLIGEAPFPRISPVRDGRGGGFNVAIVGDSFGEQIGYALARSLPETNWTPDALMVVDIRPSLRRNAQLDGALSSATAVKLDSLLPEILTKDLLIMVRAETLSCVGNLDDMELGVTRIFLNGLLSDAQGGANDPRRILTEGWSSQGEGNWRTTGSEANFVIRRPAEGSSISLALDVESESLHRKAERFLTVLLEGQPVGEVKLLPGRGVIHLQVPTTVQFQDDLLAEISLQDASGEPLDMLLRGIQQESSVRDETVNGSQSTQTELRPRARNIRLRTLNLMSRESREDFLAEGLSSLESNGKDIWRWALGPKTSIKFYVDPSWLDDTRRMMLLFAYKSNLVPGQTVTLRLNGEEIRFFSSKEIRRQTKIDIDLPLAVRKGINVLEILYGDWNFGKKIYASKDPRKLAVRVTRLMIRGES